MNRIYTDLHIFLFVKKMTDTAAIIAYNFYEHKDPEKLLAEGNAEKVTIKLVEAKEEQTTYDIGGAWTAIHFTPKGKKASVTIRPVLKA
jgi:hypothetical protein